MKKVKYWKVLNDSDGFYEYARTRILGIPIGYVTKTMTSDEMVKSKLRPGQFWTTTPPAYNRKQAETNKINKINKRSWRK